MTTVEQKVPFVSPSPLTGQTTNANGRIILTNPGGALDEDQRMEIQNTNQKILSDMFFKAIQAGCIDVSNGGFMKNCSDSCPCTPICE